MYYRNFHIFLAHQQHSAATCDFFQQIIPHPRRSTVHEKTIVSILWLISIYRLHVNNDEGSSKGQYMHKMTIPNSEYTLVYETRNFIILICTEQRPTAGTCRYITNTLFSRFICKRWWKWPKIYTIEARKRTSWINKHTETTRKYNWWP